MVTQPIMGIIAIIHNIFFQTATGLAYWRRIRKDLKTAFEVRKLSRRGSVERGEADLAEDADNSGPRTPD